MAATSDTATADMTAMSRHIDNNDSNERRQQATATGDMVATSGHVDDNDSDKRDVHNDNQDKAKADTMTTRQPTGNTPTMMNMTTATDGVTWQTQ